MIKLSNIQNINIGPCQVKFGAAGAEVDLGYTQGGVKVSFSSEEKEIEVDQVLDPVDTVIIKRVVTVEAPFAEYTLDTVKLALPGSEEVIDGTDPTKKKLLIKSTGESMVSMLTYAKSLILHPSNLESSDASEDFTFPNAAPNGNIEVSYDKENPKIITVVFRCFPDEDGVTAIFGDKTAVAGE